MHEQRARRRKCRRPRFSTEAKALAYARLVLKQPERTAYACSAHEPAAYHLHPKGHERTA